MSGKGSAPRPFSVKIEEYHANFDRIFKKDQEQDGKDLFGHPIDELNINEELEDRDITPGL